VLIFQTVSPVGCADVVRFGFCRCVFRSRCRRAIMIYWRRNRLAVGCPPYVAAQQSVAHLTFADTSWRSVPTCSVLLRTEAGGTPAFQSVAASRQLAAAPTLCDLVLPMRFGDPVVGLRRRNRLAVGCPPYVIVPRTVGYLTLPFRKWSDVRLYLVCLV
jgi:hypothetical protein